MHELVTLTYMYMPTNLFLLEGQKHGKTCGLPAQGRTRFGVKALLSDGASGSVSLMKLFCGHKDDSQKLTPSFISPFSGERVFLIVCPSMVMFVSQ